MGIKASEKGYGDVQIEWKALRREGFYFDPETQSASHDCPA